MIVREPAERDPCIQRLHDSGRVEIMDPENGALEAEVTGDAGNERAAERLVGDGDRSFEPEGQCRRGVGDEQPLVDAADASSCELQASRSLRTMGERTRK